MSAKRIILYMENTAELDVETLSSLVDECQASSQLDTKFHGATPLCVAATTECETAVKLLLQAGASVNWPSGFFVRSPLHDCVHYEEETEGTTVAIAKLLLKYGADVNQKDKDGLTPLHLACRTTNKECVDLLIKSGARLRRDKGVPSYLCTACSYATNTDMIEYLMSQGADVNDRDNLHKMTALHNACISPKVGHEIVEFLLQKDADVNAISDTGYSALHYACKAVRLRKVKVLLNWGANIQHVNEYNFTPLGVLLPTRVKEGLFGDYETIVNLLLAVGATLSDFELETIQTQLVPLKMSIETRQLKQIIPLNQSLETGPKKIVPLNPSQIELNITKFIDKVYEQCKVPDKLINLCRIKVRSCIAGRKDTKVKDLCLPRYLKEFLVFSDLC